MMAEPTPTELERVAVARRQFESAGLAAAFAAGLVVWMVWAGPTETPRFWMLYLTLPAVVTIVVCWARAVLPGWYPLCSGSAVIAVSVALGTFVRANPQSGGDTEPRFMFPFMFGLVVFLARAHRRWAHDLGLVCFREAIRPG